MAGSASRLRRLRMDVYKGGREGGREGKREEEVNSSESLKSPSVQKTSRKK